MTSEVSKRAKWTPQRHEKAKINSRRQWHEGRDKMLRSLNRGNVGNTVRELRLALQMNQGEFADAVGLSQKNGSQVSHWENGLNASKRSIEAMNDLAASHGIFWSYHSQS